MRTGEKAGSAATQRGYSYLVVLFLIALTAAALAGLGQAWSTAAQREKERELEFRGRAIAAAIASYQRAGRSGPGELPRSLDDLLEDRRDVIVRHHLRKRYVDPFTGEADWELIPAPADASRFYGVRSRSDRLLLRVPVTSEQRATRACGLVFTSSIAAGQNGRTPVNDDSSACGRPRARD